MKLSLPQLDRYSEQFTSNFERVRRLVEPQRSSFDSNDIVLLPELVEFRSSMRGRSSPQARRIFMSTNSLGNPVSFTAAAVQATQDQDNLSGRQKADAAVLGDFDAARNMGAADILCSIPNSSLTSNATGSC